MIYIGLASKPLTPALRLGWIVAPRRLIELLAREKHLADMGSSLFEQVALAPFIQSGARLRLPPPPHPADRGFRVIADAVHEQSHPWPAARVYSRLSTQNWTNSAPVQSPGPGVRVDCGR